MDALMKVVFSFVTVVALFVSTIAVISPALSILMAALGLLLFFPHLASQQPKNLLSKEICK